MCVCVYVYTHNLKMQKSGFKSRFFDIHIICVCVYTYTYGFTPFRVSALCHARLISFAIYLGIREASRDHASRSRPSESVICRDRSQFVRLLPESYHMLVSQFISCVCDALHEPWAAFNANGYIFPHAISNRLSVACGASERLSSQLQILRRRSRR